MSPIRPPSDLFPRKKIHIFSQAAAEAQAPSPVICFKCDKAKSFWMVGFVSMRFSPKLVGKDFLQLFPTSFQLPGDPDSNSFGRPGWQFGDGDRIEEA